jgi:hypothetical protein
MAIVDLRAAYELLQRALEQQSQQANRLDAPPGGMSGQGDGSYGGAQGGLLGRLRALQAQPNGEDMPPQPRDPNFRQLSRLPSTSRPPVAMSPYPRNDQNSPSNSSIGVAAPLIPPLRRHKGAGCVKATMRDLQHPGSFPRRAEPLSRSEGWQEKGYQFRFRQ